MLLKMSIAELEANREARAKEAASLFIPSDSLADDFQPGQAPARSAQNLLEKYRPRHLIEVVGQDPAVKIMRSYLDKPYPVAFLFGGATGVGKTTMALVLANELGCDLNREELGGVWQIPSGEQSVASVRELCGRLHFVPFYGSGWKVCVINEADYMTPQAEAVWLDVLENLPPRTVVVFTTNAHGKLSQRFKDRCYGIPFSSKPENLGEAVRKLARRVWQGETGRTDCPEVPYVVAEGAVSFRRVVQGVARLIDSAA